MAIALVPGQSAEKIVTSSSGTTLAFPSNVTAGNLLIAVQTHFNNLGAAITTPTDTLAHTYVAVDTQVSVDSNTQLRMYYVENCSGGANTVTFDIEGVNTGDITVNIFEFSGVATTSALLDGQNAGPSTGTAVSTGNVTPSEDNCLLIAAMSHNGADTSITEEWTLLQENEGGSANMPLATQYKVQTTATTEDGDWTLGASRTWGTQLGVFKSAGGAATAVKDIIGGYIPHAR